MSQPAAQHINIDTLQSQFETASPQTILRWAVEQYGRRLAVVTSFQPTGIATIHMLNDIAPGVPVITLDTGLLFPETYQLMDELESRFNLNLIRVQPKQTIAQQAEKYGDALWERDPDRCCHLRKTVPLCDALEGYEAWIAGLRRDQSTQRANIPIISWDERNQLVKLNPFANWTESMLWTYIHAHELPYNTLHDRGYPSIGCTTCTRAVQPEADGRSGRWSNHEKTECGIHVTLIGDNQGD